MGKLYPDISHHHTVKSWPEVAKSVSFMISKATEGVTFRDPYLTEFVKGCEQHGIPYWLYTYLRKGNELAQAQYMVKTCKNIVGKMFRGYVLDIEENNGENGCINALNWLKTQSPKTIIYVGWSDRSRYRNLIDGRGENCAWWEARYGRNDGTYNPSFPHHDGVDLHQYTSQGICPGIPDRIDLNRLTGKKPLEWFTGETVNNSPVLKVEISFPSRGYYTVGDGYTQYKSYGAEIKKIQKLCNEIAKADLEVDGKYGKLTKEGVKKLQVIVGTKDDGLFGNKTLTAVNDYKR